MSIAARPRKVSPSKPAKAAAIAPALPPAPYSKLFLDHYGELFRTPLASRLVDLTVPVYQCEQSLHLDQSCYELDRDVPVKETTRSVGSFAASALAHCPECMELLPDCLPSRGADLWETASDVARVERSLAAALAMKSASFSSLLGRLGKVTEATRELSTIPASVALRPWRKDFTARLEDARGDVLRALRSKRVLADLALEVQTQLAPGARYLEQLGWDTSPVLLGVVSEHPLRSSRSGRSYEELVEAVLLAHEVPGAPKGSRVALVPRFIADFLYRTLSGIQLWSAPPPLSDEHLALMLRLWMPAGDGPLVSLAVAHRQAVCVS